MENQKNLTVIIILKIIRQKLIVTKKIWKLLIGKKETISLFLVRFQKKVMLYVSSTLLFLVNAVTCRRVKSILFNRVAILILLYSGIIYYDSLNIILLDTGIGIYGGLFHSTFTTHSFALFLCIIRAIVFFSVYYPRRSQKSMGAMGKKMSSFLLTKYTDSYFDLYQNNMIKI